MTLNFFSSVRQIAIIGSVGMLSLVGTLVLVLGGSDGPDQPAVRHVEALWGRGYETLGELAADAQLVVEGVVTAAAPYDPESDPVPLQRGEPRWPHTDWTVDVSTVFWSDPTIEVGDTIVVSKIYGLDADGVLVVFDGQPPFEIGEHVLLFLDRPLEGNPRFRILGEGGPFGHLTVLPDGTLTNRDLAASNFYPGEPSREHPLVTHLRGRRPADVAEVVAAAQSMSEGRRPE